MNGRRSLTTLGLSLLLHAFLVLAIGFFLNRPTRVIQHIEVALETTGAAVHPEKETPAAQPSPAPTPEPPKPKPEPSPEPALKPIVKPPEKKPKPRTKIKQPAAVKVEETEPVNAEPNQTVPDSAQKESTETAETNTKTEAGSINTPAADYTYSGGQKAEASALQAWLAAIRARIAKAKRYPMMAERRRIQGEVIVSFRLSFDGLLLEEPKVTSSSRSSLLDGAAVRAVKRAAPFPRFPGPLEEMPAEPLSVELDFVIR